jgi:hypothetical protein
MLFVPVETAEWSNTTIYYIIKEIKNNLQRE